MHVFRRAAAIPQLPAAPLRHEPHVGLDPRRQQIQSGTAERSSQALAGLRREIADADHTGLVSQLQTDPSLSLIHI